MQVDGADASESREGLSSRFAKAATAAASRRVHAASETAAEAGETAAADMQAVACGASEEGCAGSPTAAESGATLSDDRNHPQQQQHPLLGKRTSAAEQFSGDRHGVEEADNNVFVSVEDEETHAAKANDASLAIAAFVLSFLFPPIGCLIFCLSLSYPPESPRYVWAVRALELGSLLSFVYSLVIIMVLSDFTLIYSQNKAHFGVGF